MSAATYQLSLRTFLFGSAPLVRDQAEERDARRLELDAQVRSGDYFISLATKLDQLSKNTTDDAVKASLDRLTSDMMYLQTHYTSLVAGTYALFGPDPFLMRVLGAVLGSAAVLLFV